MHTNKVDKFLCIQKKKKKQEERKVRLREHARRLIAETRAKSHNLDSPSSPIKLITHRITLSPERTISPINTGDSGQFFGGKSKESSPVKLGSGGGGGARVTPPRAESMDGSTMANSRRSSPTKSNSAERNGNSPLQSFNSVLDRISPQREKKVSMRECE